MEVENKRNEPDDNDEVRKGKISIPPYEPHKLGIESSNGLCFATSVIQVIASIPSICVYFLEEFQNDINHDSGLTSEFALMIKALKDKDGKQAVSAHRFLEYAAMFIHAVRKHRGHSLHFLIELVCVLSRELSKRKMPTFDPSTEAEARYLEHIKDQPSIFREELCGVLSVREICSSCLTTEYKLSPFLTFSLRMEATTIDFKQAILNKLNNLDDEPDSINCKVCEETVIRSADFAYLPKVFFSLKISEKFMMPKDIDIDLSEDIIIEATNPENACTSAHYKLQTVLVKHEPENDPAHIFTFSRGEKGWISYDGTTVEENVSFDDVKKWPWFMAFFLKEKQDVTSM